MSAPSDDHSPADDPGAAGHDASADEDRVRRIVRVHGRVQGVGFRMDAAAAANRLGIAGTVRNLLDGTVEADVEGSGQAVESMIAHLREGPRSARVDGLDVRRAAPRGTSGFRISG